VGVMVEVVPVVVMPVMMMTMTAIHHMPHSPAVHHLSTATMPAAVIASFGFGGQERGHNGNNRCDQGDKCSALEHSVTPWVRRRAYPGRGLPMSLKTRLLAVLAITK
jgi:hypothetical protein